MPSWFCGVPAVWHLFASPLNPRLCYFSATIERSTLEAQFISVWDRKEDCRCVPDPAPPPPPPQQIFFCGERGVWHFFDHPLEPRTCYSSFHLTRIEVMSQGVDVYHDEASCDCIPKSPPPSPPPPLLPPPPPSPPMICENSCLGLMNNICQDGGEGSVPGNHCELGTDCHDCGPRPVPTPEVLAINTPSVRSVVSAETPLSPSRGSSASPVSSSASPGEVTPAEGIGFLQQANPAVALEKSQPPAQLSIPMLVATLIGCSVLVVLARGRAAVAKQERASSIPHMYTGTAAGGSSQELAKLAHSAGTSEDPSHPQIHVGGRSAHLDCGGHEMELL